MGTNIDKVLLVVNPVAGDTDKEPIIKMVRDFLSKQSEFKTFKTTGSDDIPKLRKSIKDFKPERILVAGGDGTVKMAAQASKNMDKVLGILPAGSANGLATDLNLPTDNREALYIAMGGTTTKVDALQIGDSIGLHISDMGVNAELIQNYSESGIRGRFGYFLNSIPTLLQTDSPYVFSISANGVDRVVNAVMVAFANSKKFGTGALVNPEGKINDGKFEVLIFKKLNVAEIFKTLKGDIDMDDNFVESFATTAARITTEKPVAFQIDGEPQGSVDDVSVSIIADFTEIAVGQLPV